MAAGKLMGKFPRQTGMRATTSRLAMLRRFLLLQGSILLWSIDAFGRPDKNAHRFCLSVSR
jgi:hypothetical protein